MRSPLEKHVSSLYQPFLHELITELSGLARFPSASQKYPSFFILDGHEVGWDLDVDDVGAVTVGAEVVHEEVVSVVHEEVERVEHISIVLQHRDLQRLFHDLSDLVFALLSVLDELNALLLLLLLNQVIRFLDKFLCEFYVLLYVLHLVEELHIVFALEFALLQHQELLIDVRLLTQLLRLLFHVDNVGFLE
jgi:hypothetical protein